MENREDPVSPGPVFKEGDAVAVQQGRWRGHEGLVVLVLPSGAGYHYGVDLWTTLRQEECGVFIGRLEEFQEEELRILWGASYLW